MGCLGNSIWIICGGIWQALGWFLMGLLWCLTIVGIPIGRQCFKLASLSLAPFDKDVEYGGGVPSMISNIFWLLIIGIPLRLVMPSTVYCCAVQ